ncbi:MAG TPA: glycerol-3-phosphate dehydrogenase, partial [Ramlibacter sp.]|nr:glycerol-3-phosphate dehydrogenase [Ramlibacter sp.]
EGVYSARTVVERAGRLGVDMPISSAVVDLLDGHATPQEAVARLMARDPASENVGVPSATQPTGARIS